jgi:hypothetical protein
MHVLGRAVIDFMYNLDMKTMITVDEIIIMKLLLLLNSYLISFVSQTKHSITTTRKTQTKAKLTMSVH